MSTSKPGPKPRFNVDELKLLVQRYRHQIATNGTVACPSSSVWSTISEELGNITNKAVYTYVHSNRYGLKDMLPLSESDTGEAHSVDPIETALASSPSSTSSGPDVTAANEDAPTITVSLPPDAWQALLQTVTYKRSESQRPSIPARKQYILKPNAWVPIVKGALQSATSAKCSWRFQRARLTPNGEKYLDVRGCCVNCGATVDGASYFEPEPGQAWDIEFEIKGGNPDNCCGPLKDRLCGQDRTQLAEQLLDTSQSALQWRRKRASTTMEIGDAEPAHLYSADVIRKAKSEHRAASRAASCPIQALVRLKSRPELETSIYDVGQSPFFVHYWSKAQSAVYSSVFRQGHCTVCVDATGSVVANLSQQRPHIFLYQIVMPSCAFSRLFPVSQMLSARQDTVSIAFWLGRWVSSGVPTPKVVVCDRSLALLSAVARSFCGTSGIAAYMEQIWANMCNASRPAPVCLIRIDVAHMIKGIASLACLNQQPPRVKKFYIGSSANLLVANSLPSAKRILSAILIVAQTEMDGFNVLGDVEAEGQREYLRSILSSGLEIADNSANASTASATGNDEFRLPEQLQQWLDAAFEESLQRVQQGSRENPHFLPNLVPCLKKLTKTILLWSNMSGIAMANRLPSRPSSAAVENYFGDLKQRVIPIGGKLRCDEFVEKHLAAIDGQLKLAAAPVSAPEAEIPASAPDSHAISYASEQPDATAGTCEDTAVEDWRGLGTSNKKKKRWSYFTPEPSWASADLTKVQGGVQLKVLRNSSLLAMKPVNVRISSGVTERVLLTNTCAFDSILHAFSAARCDCSSFNTFCMNSSNEFVQLAGNLIVSGPNLALYNARAQLLRQHFAGERLEGGLVQVGCHCAVGVLARLLLRNGPYSLTESSSCTNGADCPRGNASTPMAAISVSIPEGAINNLADFVQETMESVPRPCLAAAQSPEADASSFIQDLTISSNALCSGIRTGTLVMGNLLLLELVGPSDNSTQISSRYDDHNVEAVVRCQLDAIPLSLDLNGHNYTLQGLVQLIPPDNDAIIGHYVTVVRRPNGTWQRINDVEDRPQNVGSRATMVVSMLLYVL